MNASNSLNPPYRAVSQEPSAPMVTSAQRHARELEGGVFRQESQPSSFIS